MQTGAITGYMDVAQLVLYAFWLFFAGLVFYLVRENKREGYPLVTEVKGEVIPGFPVPPPPKSFIMHDGHVFLAPRKEQGERVAGRHTASWNGSPIVPTGNPLVDGVGPAAYAQNRMDKPDVTFDDELPKIVPLRNHQMFWIATEDPNPEGMAVYGHDGALAGTVVDSWVDRSEVVIRYFEVELADGGGRVLLPQHFARINRKRRQIKVGAITGAQFRDVPRLKNADTVTNLEEEKLMGYFGGGFLYSTPKRSEPIL